MGRRHDRARGRWKPLLSALRDRRGNIAIMFALALAPLLGMTGLGSDLLLTVVVKERLQGAADAAALAAGKVMASGRPAADARRYFDANYPADFFGSRLSLFEVSEEPTNELVVVDAAVTVPTNFIRLFGFPTLDVTASSAVGRENRGVELVLVMDDTGSMHGADRLKIMKAAARGMIDVVYGDREERDRLWVGMVPYTDTVNIGPTRTKWLAADDPARTGTNDKPWKGCVSPRPDPHDRTDAPPGEQPFTSYYYGPDYSSGGGNTPGCGLPIVPLTPRKSVILSAIDAMEGEHRGGAAGHLGPVWGWRVLSPRWQGLWGGETPSDMPLPYEEPLMDKIVVVMTDGTNHLNGGKSHFIETCDGMKAAGLEIYTIIFGPTNGTEMRQLYESCASDRRKFFLAPTEAELRNAALMIGESLSDLRILR